jgi:AcrR family transcriptional regulator
MQILKDEIRERILVIAEDLFYKMGYERTTTRSIAANVEISVSNLYLYYENKEDIFSAVIEPYYVYLNSRFEEILGFGNTEEDINDKLSRLMRELIVKDWKRFIILTDRSTGTKYECSKTMAIQGLKKHIYSLMTDAIIFDKESMSFILSNNLICGMVEIAKNYRDVRQLEDNLKHLVTYHTEGLKALLS